MCIRDSSKNSPSFSFRSGAFCSQAFISSAILSRISPCSKLRYKMHSFNLAIFITSFLPCCFILLFCCEWYNYFENDVPECVWKMLYAKYAAKWDVQIVEMIFQTRSGIMEMIFNNFPKFSFCQLLPQFLSGHSSLHCPLNFPRNQQKNGTASSSLWSGGILSSSYSVHYK